MTMSFALRAGILALAIISLTTKPVRAADQAADRTAAILTPKAGDTPRINGARVYGERPGRPFLYHVPTTGKRPMTFAAEGLPEGLKIDPQTGTITGRVGAAGTYQVNLTARNDLGSDKAKLKIVIGATLALTPQMGWNSWNFFHRNIDDPKVRAAADAMVSSGLIEHGWTYINVDDCWQGTRDEQGRIQGNAKFPDMKALCDYVHGRGLKFGTYSSPGPKTCAGFEGTYRHEAQDVQTYSQWGVDYLKYDLCSYRNIEADRLEMLFEEQLPDDAVQIKALLKERNSLPNGGRPPRRGAPPIPPEQQAKAREIRDKLDAIHNKLSPEKRKQLEVTVQQEPYRVLDQYLQQAPRDILYSLCQYGLADVWKWGPEVHANSWRTTGDIRAQWSSIDRIGFSQNDLAPYAGPGHWNDPDMLEVGNGNLTLDEMYAHFSLWCLLSSPLLIGCDMSRMDALVVSIFSNDEVIAVDQDALGRQATRMAKDGEVEVWAKPLSDGSLAVGLFNRGQSDASCSAKWSDLKLTGSRTVRDLWRQKDLGSFDNHFNATVHPHGVMLIHIGPVQRASTGDVGK